jgi:hypothetical protein
MDRAAATPRSCVFKAPDLLTLGCDFLGCQETRWFFLAASINYARNQLWKIDQESDETISVVPEADLNVFRVTCYLTKGQDGQPPVGS